MKALSAHQDRPVIVDYRTVPEFISAMLKWRRFSERGFSIRKAMSATPGISSGLVTLVASGKRRLTRDRVSGFARLLGLSREESLYLDRWVASERMPSRTDAPVEMHARPVVKRGTPENHLLNHWLNLYVKDAAELKGFKADARTVHRLLGGIASVEQIERSLEYLLKHGFLRRKLDGSVAKNVEISTTTHNVPNPKIRQFHKRALKLAERAIDLYPVHRRRATAVVLSLNHSSVDELQAILGEFHERLLAFVEEHEGENEGLYQVLINLSPIGGSCDT